MKKKIPINLKYPRLSRVLGVTVLAASFAVAGAAPPVNAGIYDGLDSVTCMADAWEGVTGHNLPKDSLNCTANDIEITRVVPLDDSGKRPGEEGYIPVKCVPGEVFTLQADVTVRTNANERYDTTFYLPLTEQSPQDVQIEGPENRNCSMILPIPDDEKDPDQVADVQIDGDRCGDISKAYGTDEYTLYDETITMLCKISPEDPTLADFSYCAAWSVDNEGGCTEEGRYPGQVPSQKSKCNCANFPIPVYVAPDPPPITKTLDGTGSRSEFGGEFTYNLSFQNQNTGPTGSLFIQALTDEIDINGDGSWDQTINLWGPLDTVNSDIDGVYLTYSDCVQPPNGGELSSNATYSCQFKVYIVDHQLPLVLEDGTSPPELYDDLIKVKLKDMLDNPIGNTSCADAGLLSAVDGDNCSNVVEVQITNVDPVINVTKTADTGGVDPNRILEPGGNVTYTVVVTNPSTALEPVYLTSMVDEVDGVQTDLTSGCELPLWLNPGQSHECTFEAEVTGNPGTTVTDTVTVTGEDNEGNPATDSDPATVWIEDVESVIELIKTANPTEVCEPGGDVTYTFEVINRSTVDTVTINSLTDTVYGDLTEECGLTDAPWVLEPNNDSATCTITRYVEADAAAAPAYEHNVATASGLDDDGNTVEDDDDAKVDFCDVPPAATLTKSVVSMDVTYEVTVCNDSTAEAALLTALVDDKIGGTLDGVGGCSLDQTLAPKGDPDGNDCYTCQFHRVITSSPDTDEVTGTVSDNEGNTVTPSDRARVEFNNSPPTDGL